MNFWTKTRQLFSVYKVDPKTKVEFWNFDCLNSSEEGRKGVKSLEETTPWSEVKNKWDIQKHLDKDYGANDVIVYCIGNIGGRRHLIGCTSAERFYKSTGEIPTIKAEDREAWLETQKLLQFDYHISLATDVANDLIKHFRKMKEDYLASKKTSSLETK